MYNIKYDIEKVIELRDNNKLTWNQIEEKIGVSKETLRKAYKRKLKNLKSTEANPNTAINQKLRGLKRKYSAILEKGGKCQICGYNKNISALEFHHRNPKEKYFTLDIRAFANKRLNLIKVELEKCDLLCSNCHKELHHPQLNISNLENQLKEIEQHRVIFEHNINVYKYICPTCNKEFIGRKNQIYCSNECKYKTKDYPSIEKINKQYDILKSWQKVADFFGLTRKIIQGIRKRNNL